MFPIYATAVEFPPHRERPLARKDVRAVLAEPKILQVVFTLAPVDFSQGDKTDAQMQLPGSLTLYVGRIGPRGLEKSFIGTMDANDTWKKINKDLKKKTTAGADYVFDDDGTRRHSRTHRFTPGAKALSKAGIPLRNFAQDNYIFYPE
jgi:hypothetical protein